MRISAEERKRRANEIHNRRYGYSLWPLTVNAKTKVLIVCKEHGVFTQSIEHHINRGCGCPKCSAKRRQQTMKNRYGVENASQIEGINEKKKQTCFGNYGVEHPTQSETVRDKTRHTNLKRYGVENISQVDDIKKKKKQTCFGNYGVEYPQQSEHIRNKRENNNIKKYGVSYPTRTHLSDYTIKKLEDVEWLKEQHHGKQRTISDIAEELKFDVSTLCSYFKKYDIDIKFFYQSMGEREVDEFVKSFGLTTIVRSRDIIPPFEIDIFIPEYNIGIEYNGDYWHGDNFPQTQEKDKIKRDMCECVGIDLIIIKECDWATNSNSVKRFIKSAFYGEQ